MAYGVVKKQLKAGDIIIIPAGVVHGWVDIPEHVDYLSFRPSPLTAGWCIRCSISSRSRHLTRLG